MTTTPPGWYHAGGDPERTVRWWDGREWSDEPVPPPPGWTDPYRPVADLRYAKAGIRIGASLLDGLVSLIVIAPFFIPFFGDVLDDIEAGGDGSTVSLPPSLLLLSLGLTVVFVLMTAFLGGTPGKLMLGLRITTDDGNTTPPGLKRAFMRFLPQFVALIPVLGQAVASIVPIAAFIMVLTDKDERRSIYDRIGGTRVVYKSKLTSWRDQEVPQA